MVYTDQNTKFIDKDGLIYLINRLKEDIANMSTANIDLSSYVTKDELQTALDELNIDVDLSSYATKEELETALDNITVDLTGYATEDYVTTAIANAQLGGGDTEVNLSEYAKKTDLDAKADKEHTHTMADITDYVAPDLSEYALKTDIPTVPSLDGYATTEYVDEAIANIPTGDGSTDLSNYYTKEEVDEIVSNISDDVEYIYDKELDFSGKTFYFDRSKNLSELLPESEYLLYMYTANSTTDYAVNMGANFHYKNGVLTYTTPSVNSEGLTGISGQKCFYSLEKEDGEECTIYGDWDEELGHKYYYKSTYLNHWGTDQITFSVKLTRPVFGVYRPDEPSVANINAEEFYNAFMSCVTKIVDADGNEVQFRTKVEKEEVISPTVAITETENGHTVAITDVNGTQSFEVTNGTDGETPDLTGYATEEYVSTAINSIPSTDLSNYYNKEETYSKTEVDELVANSGSSDSGSSSSGGSSGITYAYETEIATGETWIDGKPIYMKVFHVDALEKAPSSAISYSSYHSQDKFAETIVSINTTWVRNNYYTSGNSVISPSAVGTSASSVGANVNDYIIKKELWVTVSNSTNFYIQVVRGSANYTYACDVFVKYTKL